MELLSNLSHSKCNLPIIQKCSHKTKKKIVQLGIESMNYKMILKLTNKRQKNFSKTRTTIFQYLQPHALATTIDNSYTENILSMLPLIYLKV